MGINKLLKILIMFKTLTYIGECDEHLNIPDAAAVEVYGPGWDVPQLIFASRYFFVSGMTLAKAEITSDSDIPCRVWTQILSDTNFGNKSFTIVRYKVMSNFCRGMEIKLFNENNKIIARKVIPEDIYSEECLCQRKDWSVLMKCDDMSLQLKQIDDDLRIFQSIDFDAILEEMKRRFATHKLSYSFCHYQIISNKLYRKCYGEYVGFAQFMDEILISLLRKTSLPDTEFMVNLGDWPLSDKKIIPPLPIFSWCGSIDTNDIVIPTYELTESSIHMQGRVSLDILSSFGKQSEPFKSKKSQAFWRGRDSNEWRLKLIQLSKAHPNLINASLTNFFFFRDKIDDYGPVSSHMSFFDFFQYKYQITIDGTVAAYRMPYLLAGNSLVLKQNSNYYEFFYKNLKSDYHYIAIDTDLNNLIPVLKQLIQTEDSNDSETENIINNARLFTLNNLLPQHIYCYHFNVISRYAKLIQKPVQLRPEMKSVTNDNAFNCNTNAFESKDEL